MASPPDPRPDPDALLERLRADDPRGRATKLKIFFGFAPGVGKTFAMLEGARALAARGTDVVIGAVETHGREDTAALMTGLEVVPRKKMAYRGQQLAEFDLDAARARKPQILLLDELAHTNAPGSRHDKRWQDVFELLDAGIEVHTTLNVQHVESLNDVVAQITRVRVRETVPDAVLDRANEIELVDLPPEELLVRLRSGKVYLPEDAARAAEHFFKEGNLLALRELALRRTAERVDADVLAYRERHGVTTTWPAQERVLVCVGPAPASARLVRAARRIAAGLRAPWIAAYVEPLHASRLLERDQARLESHLRLAESLGADVARLAGDRVSHAILGYARRHNVTRILIGKPTHPRLLDLIRGSVVDEIVRGSGDIDVHVISGDAEKSAEREAAPSRTFEPVPLSQYAIAVALVAAATVVASVGRRVLAEPDHAMLFLFVVVVAAATLRRGPSIVTAALGVLAYDFSVVHPLGSFDFADPRNLLTFVMMFVMGIVVSSLMDRIRSHERLARDREARTAALFALTRELGKALSDREIAVVLARHARDALGVGVAVYFDPNVVTKSVEAGPIALSSGDLSVVLWTLAHARPAGRGTDTLPGSRVACFPIRAGASVGGAIAVVPGGDGGLDRSERSLVEAFADAAAIVMARARLAEEAKRAALRARDEEMRNALLSAVSHDLRTPLATITGSATTLREDDAMLTPEQRRDLLEGVVEEAERLERLVANLLEMTRLQSGGVHLKREWVPLEEPIVSALSRLEKRIGERPISVAVEPDVPLVSMDALLFEQVIVNLVENALKYTPALSPIEIQARVRGEKVELTVADRGPGIPKGSFAAIFDKFHRGVHPEIGGVGLGLSICRGILEAHGGTIEVANRESGGAVFTLSLPIDPQAPDPHEGSADRAPDELPDAPQGASTT